jgi:hypothetical protein
MDCISCGSPLDRGVVKLATSLGAERVICAVCLTTYSEREEITVQMNVRIPRDLDAQLREAARMQQQPYARIVRDRLRKNT